MLVLRKCIVCNIEFSFNFYNKQKRFCDKCANKRRQVSNKLHKLKFPERYRAYQKAYYKKHRGKQYEE